MYRLIALHIALAITLMLTGGCQKKEQAVPAPEARTEQQLDTEYRSILAEAGLYNGGEVPTPKQIEPGQYGQVLCLTAAHGSTEMLVRLLAARPDININESVDGRTMLHCASASLHSTNSNLLLERGIQPNAQDNQGRTALHLVVSQPDGVNLARLLLSRGARVDARDEKGMTALMNAGAGSIKMLVDKGADLSAQDANGNTALHWAAYRKNPEAIAQLLSLGTPLELQNVAGKTALHQAVESNNLPTTELLLKAGARIDTPDVSGTTPLQAAEKSGNKVLMGIFSHYAGSDKGSKAQ
jgi:ankyrin repeat protein